MLLLSLLFLLGVGVVIVKLHSGGSSRIRFEFPRDMETPTDFSSHPQSRATHAYAGDAGIQGNPGERESVAEQFVSFNNNGRANESGKWCLKINYKQCPSLRASVALEYLLYTISFREKKTTISTQEKPLYEAAPMIHSPAQARQFTRPTRD